MAKQYRAEHRGKLFNLLWPFSRYVITNLTVAVAFVVFFLINRTIVLGRKNVGHEKNTLLLSNHQSMIDSFLVGMCAYYPWSWIRPYLVPWNPAAEENFYRRPILAWLSDQWKCIPVKEGRRDLRALHRMMIALKEGTMTLFPEGTRTRDGTIGQGRAGTGLLVLGNHPTVIPVVIDGMGELLPIGSSRPRIGKRIYVYFGKPFDYSTFLERPRSKETAQELVDRIMDVVRRQQRVVQRLKRFRSRRAPKGAGHP